MEIEMLGSQNMNIVLLIRTPLSLSPTNLPIRSGQSHYSASRSGAETGRAGEETAPCRPALAGEASRPLPGWRRPGLAPDISRDTAEVFQVS